MKRGHFLVPRSLVLENLTWLNSGFSKSSKSAKKLRIKKMLSIRLGLLFFFTFEKRKGHSRPWLRKQMLILYKDMSNSKLFKSKCYTRYQLTTPSKVVYHMEFHFGVQVQQMLYRNVSPLLKHVSNNWTVSLEHLKVNLKNLESLFFQDPFYVLCLPVSVDLNTFSSS